MKDEVKADNGEPEPKQPFEDAMGAEEKRETSNLQRAPLHEWSMYVGVRRFLSALAGRVGADWKRGSLRRIEDKERWQLFFLLMAVLVAAYTCRVFILQLNEMKSGSGDTHLLAMAAKREAAKAETISSSVARAVIEMHAQSQAAQDAANAAKRALSVQAAEFRLQERAYITPEYIRMDHKPQAGKELVGEVLWKNVGRTPALKGRLYIRIDVLRKSPCCRETWEKNAEQSKTSIDIGSGLQRSTPVEGNNPVSPKWMARLGNGFSVYIFGAFVYRDVFNKLHASDICGVYRPGSINGTYLWVCPEQQDTRTRRGRSPN